MTTPEGRIKSKLKRRLKKFDLDLWCYMPVQTMYSAPALDFILCFRGRFISIETKAPGKKPTPRQDSTIMRLLRAGADVFVLRTDDDIDKFVQYLDGLPDGGVSKDLQ